MNREITIHYSSNCPYTNQEQEIQITYAELLFSGSLIPDYKIARFSCPHVECPYPSQSRNHHCPVVDSAPKRPN